MKAVAIASGGLDSTTMLYDMDDQEVEIIYVLGFNYGQKHMKELSFLGHTCEKLGLSHSIINLWSSGLTGLLSESGSSLVSDTNVPEGHYAEENMKSTVVPNRNMIMLSIAAGVAVAKNAETVWTGVHAGDHFVYPDCRPDFLSAANATIALGNQGFGPIVIQGENMIPQQVIYAPYLNETKADIALRALELDVPLSETWSCYQGGDMHCGRCGTCVERLEAIHEARERYYEDHDRKPPVDSTQYADKDFWRGVIANA
jgi:7-cyano-7-deazaguanine synthase